MRALFLLLFLITVSFGTVAAQSGCTDLFFSEYVEGSTGNNKCVEIYNPTANLVDLSLGGYKVQVFANGAASASSTIALTGTVAAYSTYVLCNTGAGSGLLAVANQTSGSLSHNGDDALALVKGVGNTFVDIFGNIGNDPGTAWIATPASTLDQVLRRKSTVQAGITTNPGGTGSGAFATLGTEWDNFIDTDISGFGTHTSTCVPVTACSISSVTVGNFSSCNDNGTPLNASDDYFTADVTVNYTSKPSFGTLNLSGDNIGGPSSTGVGLIGASTYTFTGVQFASDGGAISITATFSDDPACTLANLNAGTAPASCSVVPNCALPFFSEYIEGSGNNKCLEIYNPSASAIDLAAGGYKIEMYFNGASGVGLTINLAGILQPGDVYVVCNSGATADFTGQADQINGAGWFNGDDAIALRNTGGILDVIGQIGVDPGTDWNSSGLSTVDQTLRRKSSVQKGDNNGSDAFNPATQWESYPLNTFWGLGYHRTNCRPALPGGWNPFNIGCPSGTVNYNTGTSQWTLTSNCYEDLSSGLDEGTFAFQELCGDGEIVTRICGITGSGFAGVTFRETASANSKHFTLYFQNSQNAHWLIRSVTGGAVHIQSKPRTGRNWMKITRTGNLFRGYLSTNGTSWQLFFQSSVPMADCMLAGIITESNVDGTTTTANFCDVDLSFDELARPINDGPIQTEETLTQQTNGLDLPEGTDLFDNNQASGELSIRPNPVVNELEVVIPNTIQTGALLTIMDLNGKKLFTERIGEGANLVMLNLADMNLSAGVYLLNIQDGSTVLTKRFVKVN